MSGQIERINTCGNCIFSHREQQQGPMLECRESPPAPHPVVHVVAEDGKAVGLQILDVVSAWPRVAPTQFCGKHKTNAIVRARHDPLLGGIGRPHY